MFYRGGVYVVNFYGQLNNSYIRRLKAQCGHLIIDNAQAYFQMPVEGVDTLYTCRKYFGVADGAFLYTDTMLPRSLERDESYERMHFLLGRYERSANEFYAEYVANNEFFAGEPVKQMSKLTQNLLRAVDYEAVGERRKENFTYLYETLADINELHVTVPYGAFMYPLLLQDGMRIRKELQQRKIYIPTLWPNVLDECAPDSLAYHMAANILPIPVDQRYDFNDMKYLGEMIRHVSTERT